MIVLLALRAITPLAAPATIVAIVRDRFRQVPTLRNYESLRCT